MLEIVRNRRSLVSTSGFQPVSGEGRGPVSADGLVSLASPAGGRWRRRSPMRGDDEAGGFARLPGRGDAGGTELAERLLASQQKFAQDVPRATTPLLPGKGDTGATNSRGQTRQASPSRRACPPPATGPLPGGEPIAVRRGLAYHLEQKAKSTGLRGDGDRYLERADAIPGRLHPQPA